MPALLALSHNCCLPNRHFNNNAQLLSTAFPHTHTHTHTLYHRLPSKMKKLKAKTGWAGLISPHSFTVFAYKHIHTHTHSASVVFVGISCCRSVPLLTFLRFSTIFTAVIVIIFVVVIVFTPFLIKLKFS